MKKIYLTQKQLEECLMTEISLSGDEQLSTTKDPKQAAQKTIDNAQSQGLNTDNGVQVTFSVDSLKKNCGIQEALVMTKKDFQKARIKKLNENTYTIKKKDLFK